jgi:hypothetical protein
MSQRRIHRWVDVQTTIGLVTATFTDQMSPKYQLPPGSAANVSVKFIGRETTTGAAVAVSATGAFKNVGGVLSLDGALNLPSPIGGASLLGAVVGLGVSGANIVAQATGVALLTIEWMAYVELIVT